MSMLQEYLKGFSFAVFGQVGEVLRIPDEATKEVARFVRILTTGKTYNFELSSEQECLEYEKLERAGVFCRAFGSLGRRKNTTFAVARIKGLVLPGTPDWKEPSEEEFLAGMIFMGWCKLAYKRNGMYGGVPFQKVQLAAFGETFEFANVPDDVYNVLPEKTIFRANGNCEPRISSVSDGAKGSDLLLSLSSVNIPSAASTASAASPGTPPVRNREAKSA